ncbi:MAG TPA: FdhF/YdeP family oxidoreductase [Candidatus Acidoferrales bacterium]|nr:FdhF/YdeP family oxidoreductase [Candidatus Acidoferrales bacterium]
MKRARAGGGFAAVRYTLQRAREAGGLVRFARRMQQRNACKTCAVGMGGQHGGMRNEAGNFPEVCKKSVQAQAADMQEPIGEEVLLRLSIAELERLSGRELEALGRVGFPLLWREGDPHYRRITWVEAYAMAAEALRQTRPSRTFFYSSGRSSNEAAFLLQCLARAYGTNNVNNCSYYCHQASGVALQESIGTGTATVQLDDLERADLAVIIGANPASNHPRLITQLVNLRRRGGKVIVINPLKEIGLVRFRVPSDWRSMMFGSEVSDLYLQPNIGSDAALLKLLLKGVVESGACDGAFLDAHVEGWNEIVADVRSSTSEQLLAICGVPAGQIDAAVRCLIESRSSIFAWAMGITHHANGVDNVQAIVNLALSRGMLGKPGAGLLPIRGHSNVQGVGSVGVSPALKSEFAKRLQEIYGIELPATPGLHTLASVEAAGRGEIDTALLLGGNLFGASPDRPWTRQALRRIGTTIYVTTKLNEGHVHGRGRTCLILPALARDEEQERTTQESMFNFVRVSDGGAAAESTEMRSEVEIIATLGGMVLPPGPIDFGALRSHAAIREAIARVVPGFEEIREVDRTKREFHIPGRIFHSPTFPTATGRARAFVTPICDFPLGEGEMRLMTLRSEGQFNTVIYEDEDYYRGNERRDVVMMNEADAQRLGLHRDRAVRVENDTGAMDVVVRFAPLPPGNLAMYYPEANVLIPRRVDPRSATPVFKSVAVRVKAIER